MMISQYNFSGLSLPPSRSQDQLHRPRPVRQSRLRIHLWIAGERTPVLRNQDRKSGLSGIFND
jgi:hypothetical protein